MDVTDNFINYTGIDRDVFYSVGISPCLLTARQIAERADFITKKLCACEYGYVGYGRFVHGYKVMNRETCSALDDEVGNFLVDCTTRVRDFKKIVTHEHYHLIAAFLFGLIEAVSRQHGQMKKDRRRFDVNPLLLSGSLSTPSFSSSSSSSSSTEEPTLSAAIKHRVEKECKRAQNEKRSRPVVGNVQRRLSNDTGTIMVPLGFSERYISEVATVAKLTEYTDIAKRHRDQLFAQTKEMRKRFSEEALQAENIGRNINDISTAYSEFLRILASQSDNVREINETAKEAVEEVTETAEMLGLTLERSKSHNVGMITFYLVLGILLLFIDWIS
jgi:hypothetical protein